MVDLKYTYIKNDGGELLEAYFNKAVELGLHKDESIKIDRYSRAEHITCDPKCSVLQIGTHASKELTLEDFKGPERVEVGVDLTNKYVPNVDGELRDLWIKECERQGIKQFTSSTLEHGKYLVVFESHRDRSNVFGSTSREGCWTLLTLEDFKPTKPVDSKIITRVKVYCNFKSFYEAVSEILDSGEKYFVEGAAEDLSWYVKDESFLSDETLGYLLQDYDMLYRYENKTLTKYELVIDYMDSLGTVGEFTDFNDYLQSMVDRDEFVKMCKFIVDLEEGE